MVPIKNPNAMLLQALNQGDVPLLRKTLAEGASPDAMVGDASPVQRSKGEVGERAIHVAASAGFIEGVRALASHGCNLEAKDREGMTALHRACMNDRPQACKVLVDLGADLHPQDLLGRKPLSVAALFSTEATKTLIDRGAPVNDRNLNGQTALEMAVSYILRGYAECAERALLLIARGAEVDLRRELQAMDGRSGRIVLLGQVKVLGQRLDAISAKRAAAMVGDADALCDMLRQKSEPDRPGERVANLRQLAIRHGHHDTVAALDAFVALQTMRSIGRARTPAGVHGKH